jgi:biotin synthase
MLYDAGANFIYHSLRLREGVHTEFDPAERLSTLSAVKRSNLDLVYLIEPIGIEHTNEEIVDLFEVILDHNTSVSGGMARIPVAGTPLGSLPQISDTRLAHVIAFTRLASAGVVKDICVHPASEMAISFGANVAVLDSGAIPRDEKYSPNNWRGISYNDITSMFKKGGYTTYAGKV